MHEQFEVAGFLLAGHDGDNGAVSTIGNANEISNADIESRRRRGLGDMCGLENLANLRGWGKELLHGTLTVEQQQELADGTVMIGPPKSDAGNGTLQLPAFLIPELERHVARFGVPGPRGRVFAGEHGGPLRKLTLHRHWSRARAAVDLPDDFRFHDLRHTANTLAASSGASTRELMHRMGHASASASLRYQHATQDRDRALAVALDEMVTRPAVDGSRH